MARQWLEEGRAQRVAKEACEKATVTLAATAPTNNVRALVTHLRHSGQLTAGLVLRALLSGNLRLFEEALAELADLPVARVAGLVHDQRGAAFLALYQRAGLPASGYAAFRAALDALHEGGFVGEVGGATRLKRRMVERVLTRCEQEGPSEVGPLLMLLRRFATEATREEARLFCDELVERTDGLGERHRAAMVRGSGSPGASGGARILEIVRAVAILVGEEFVGHLAQLCGELAAVLLRVLRVFADDGAHRVDVLVDQRAAAARHVGRVLDQAAQAVGDRPTSGSRRSPPRP